MKPLLRTLAAGMLFAGAVSAFGWNATGHMVIARIAQKNLSPKALAEADRLLKATGKDTSADFVMVASWADETRTQATGPWHYEDHHFRTDGKPDNNKPEPENAVWAIDKFEKVLADKTKPDAERAEALRYLIHFVGDIHQPLHATAHDTDALPNGDRGGNDFHIENPAEFSTGRPLRNLHSLWDMGCGLFLGDRDGHTPEGQQRVDAQADSIIKALPKNSLKNEGDRDPEHWALESFDVCKAEVYSTPENAAPSATYLQKGRQISTTRAALAGYRLADLLNRALK